MVDFLSGLRTTGEARNFDGKIVGVLRDVDGDLIAGKCLPDFVFYTCDEEDIISISGSEYEKKWLRSTCKKTGLEKAEDYIRYALMIGNPHYSTSEQITHILTFLQNDLRIEPAMDMLLQFLDLLTELNNNSNLWNNAGWKPGELSKVTKQLPTDPDTVPFD